MNKITITSFELKTLISQNKQLKIIDVREQGEFESGAIENALNWPLSKLDEILSSQSEIHKDDPLVLYCAVGQRSLVAAEIMRNHGFKEAKSLDGGIEDWQKSQGAITGAIFSASESERYARHFRLEQVGAGGQQKLKAAKVAIVGLGGLGSPAALYLAAAGVGQLTLIDGDVVELSNLQRQVIHTTEGIGANKAESAQKTISAINPEIVAVVAPVRLDKTNIEELLSDVDVIVNGVDNFPTRYLLSDFAVLKSIPLIDCAIVGFEGQLTVLAAGNPCYRCLYPTPPPQSLAPSCSTHGVIGALPGVLGSMEAMEAIKIIVGAGETLGGRLLLYDALTPDFITLKIERREDCPACGNGGPLIDPEELCAI